jgi:hypothetical protein
MTEEENEQHCNYLTDECEDCPNVRDCLDDHLRWYFQIPQFIIDHFLSQLSNSATKVFFYLCRMANFDTDSNQFAKCFPSYKMISEVTGVKTTNMDKYMRELVGLGLIEHELRPVWTNGVYVTYHHYTIMWMKRRRELLEMLRIKTK